MATPDQETGSSEDSGMEELSIDDLDDNSLVGQRLRRLWEDWFRQGGSI